MDKPTELALPILRRENTYDGATDKGCDNPYDVVLDTTAHRLFVGDFVGNRVLVYNLDASNTLVDRTADNVLGQTNLKTINGITTQNTIYGASGLAFDPATNRLFTSSYWAHRVVVFDVASVTDGENAINVLGQSNFTGASARSTQSGMNYPVGLSFRPTTSRLFVADSDNHRVGVYDVAAITNGENAINVLGQADFTTATGATQRTE